MNNDGIPAIVLVILFLILIIALVFINCICDTHITNYEQNKKYHYERQ